MTSRAEELADKLELEWRNNALDYDTALDSAIELRRLAAIEAAARNLVKVKGRYHTEQAYKALAATLENHHG